MYCRFSLQPRQLRVRNAFFFIGLVKAARLLHLLRADLRVRFVAKKNGDVFQTPSANNDEEWDMRWALLALALFVATPASAVPFTRIDYWIGGTTVRDTILNPDGLVTAAIAPGNGNTAIAAWADYGVLRAQVNTLANTSASATSSWRDAITIDAGSLNGQMGWVTVAVNYNWTLHGVGNAYYNMDALLNLTLGTYNWGIRERIVQDCTTTNCTITEDIGRVLTTAVPGEIPTTSDAPVMQLVVSAPIEFGESFPVGVVLAAFGQSGIAGIERWSSTYVDAGNSLYWGGIVSMQDINGNDVDYTLTSLSGTDYTRSFVPTQNDGTVPAPGVGALLLAGLIAATARRSKKGQRTVH